MKLAMARQYQASGKKQEALSIYNQLITEEPNNVEVLYAIADLQLSLRRDGVAKPVLEKVLTLDPGHLDAHLRLARILYDEGGTEFMLELLNRVQVDIVAGNYAGLVRLAKTCEAVGQIEMAEQSYLLALDLEDNLYDVYSGLGRLYRDSGKIDKAKEYFRKAIAINRLSTGDYYALAHINHYTEVTDEVRAMQSLYEESQNMVAQQKKFLAYGLAKAYEDIGEYEKAFDYLLAANRLEREGSRYSSAATTKRFSNIKNVFSERFFHYHEGLGIDSDMPIFIVGMPRSGTSLTEQILSCHPQIHGAGELDDMNRLSALIPTVTGKPFPLDINKLTKSQYQKMANRYLGKLQALSGGKSFVTDKMPTNFLYIGLINLLFPNAKIIHCSRNPMDNCLSLFRHTFCGSHGYSLDLADLGDYYQKYHALMSHWHNVLPYKIYDVAYEELVTNTEEEVRALLNFCGLPFDAACLKFYEASRQVTTASAAQVRNPMYSKSISGWKKFERQLQPLMNALGPLAPAS